MRHINVLIFDWQTGMSEFLVRLTICSCSISDFPNVRLNPVWARPFRSLGPISYRALKESVEERTAEWKMKMTSITSTGRVSQAYSSAENRLLLKLSAGPYFAACVCLCLNHIGCGCLLMGLTSLGDFRCC